MESKHYEMLGDAVRTSRNNQLSSLELGKIIVNYVRLLEQESERDARDKANGKT